MLFACPFVIGGGAIRWVEFPALRAMMNECYRLGMASEDRKSEEDSSRSQSASVLTATAMLNALFQNPSEVV